MKRFIVTLTVDVQADDSDQAERLVRQFVSEEFLRTNDGDGYETNVEEAA